MSCDLWGKKGKPKLSFLLVINHLQGFWAITVNLLIFSKFTSRFLNLGSKQQSTISRAMLYLRIRSVLSGHVRHRSSTALGEHKIISNFEGFLKTIKGRVDG